MRIKRLQLVGFKSCMEKTVLDLEGGMTGIVGPNGCGKSNIVDALRWVLGEQSAKHLRGRAMEDVIFAGNDRFGPLGVAEVSLTLDNEGPGPVDEDIQADESEIVRALRKTPELEITRRLYRSGESEYLINSKLCRLRDIRELFLGTGVGTKAYSMIEQGRVGQIVGAKPEDLRLFIEEAAGTTLYRTRKQAAERKIERTRDNLLRVTDIVRELDRQANSLRRQARGAVRYQELKAREIELDQSLTGTRLALLDEKERAAGDALAELRGRETAVSLKRGALDSQRRALKLELREAEAAAEQARGELLEARAALTRAEQQRGFLTGRRGELQSAVDGARSEVEGLAERRQGVAAERSGMVVEKGRLEAAFEEAAAEKATAVAELGGLDGELRAIKSESESVDAELIDVLGKRAGLENERDLRTREVAGADERRARLREEVGSLETVAARLQSEVGEFEGQLAELDAALAEVESGKESTSDGLSAALSHRSECERAAEDERANLSRLNSKLTSLQELHDSFAGYADGVRAFMSNGGREKTGATAVIADVIDIETGFERAVAAVLNDRLQYVVVPDPEAGMVGANYLKEKGTGRASFIPRAPRRLNTDMSAPPGFSPLSDHLTVHEDYREAVEPLLEGVVVTDTLDQASIQFKANGHHATFVTLEGDVVEATGVVTGGSGTPLDEGLLARKAEIRKLQGGIAEADQQTATAEQNLEVARENAQKSSKMLQELDAMLHQLTVDRVTCQGELELRRQNASRTKERLASVRTEVSGLLEEVRGGRDRLKALEQSLLEHQERRRELEARRSGIEKALEGHADKRSSLAEAVQRCSVREVEVRQKSMSCVQRVEALAASEEDLAERIRLLDEKIQRDLAELARTGERLASPESNPETYRESVSRLTGVVEEGERVRRAVAEHVEAFDAAAEELRSRLESLRTRSGRAELDWKQIGLERTSLQESATERLGPEAVEAIRKAPPELDVADSEARAELEAVRSKIRRLGAVNLGAVSELEEIETRLADLQGQQADLERSIEDLQGSITRLNRLSRKRFQETFEAARRSFATTFPKLFRGGRAELRLTDENNLLETGVEIFVQPPGKKPGNLELLSGGEKALTAISFIFALFLHKPSPFCVLDEVDAPLDEANVDRFAGMVQSMSERSQFLVITHSKRTMEHCEKLYGVTMPQPGISKLVSVDLPST